MSRSPFVDVRTGPLNLFSRRRGDSTPQASPVTPPAPHPSDPAARSGSGAVAPYVDARPVPTTMPAAGQTPGSGAAARNLPAAPTAAFAPISHPRPQVDEEDRVIEQGDEAAEFVERLSDLDRFIGGDSMAAMPTDPGIPTAPMMPPGRPAGAPAPAPVQRAQTPPAPSPAPIVAAIDEPPVDDPDDEAQEFLDRLSDLDRFIGGN